MSHRRPFTSLTQSWFLIFLGFIALATGQTGSQSSLDRLIDAIERRDSDQIDEILKAGRVDFTKQGPQGTTALNQAIAFNLPDLAKRLVVAGADVRLPDYDGGTPLMRAAWSCNTALAAFLLERGALVDAQDRHGETALMNAAWVCQDGHMVQLLLKAGAAVNIKDKAGETALTQAAFNGDENAVRALVAAGADLNARNSEGETALSIAKGRNIGRKKSHDRICTFLRNVSRG